MKKIYRCHDPLLANHLRNLLEQGGVRCRIAHEPLAGGAGELPPIECWPELWCDESDETTARGLIEHALGPKGETHTRWACPSRQEVIEWQFDPRWHCLTGRLDERT